MTTPVSTTTTTRKIMRLASVAMLSLALTATAGTSAFATTGTTPAAQASVAQSPNTIADDEAVSESAAAQRSGFATSAIGAFEWAWQGVNIPVPSGCFLNMSVQGSGLKLDRTISGIDCVGPAATIPGLFCNWSGEYRFLDTNGEQYASEITGTQLGCGQASYSIPGASARTMQSGSICLDFRNNGTTRATTCMAVFP